MTTGGAEIRDGFRFRSGNLALDFTATLAARLKERPRELLATAGDLARWFVAAGLQPAGGRSALATAVELGGARELREAIYRLARSRIDGKRYPTRDRGLLNRWAALPPPARQLNADGQATLDTAGSDVRTRIVAIAVDAVELLGGEQAARIRGCEGAGCALLFVDASRAAERRWCSMTACGNRAKVAEFRRRRRDA
jgi:predicted RNA-binding Zn ribbon-like protein